MPGEIGLFTSVELFTGCGGLALGLSRAGFSHQLMIEFNGCAVATIEHNRELGLEHVQHWPIKRKDVREVDWKRHGGATLVAGGPPCQPFSIGGKARGDGDSRDMWPQAIRAVREIAPAAFLFENVRGLMRAKFAGYLASITDNLASPGGGLSYRVMVKQVNAADYGAAQKRHRVIIVGLRRDLDIDFGSLEQTHSKDSLLWDQWVTGEYWIRHGMRRDLNSFEAMDSAAVRRLRKHGDRPTHKPWVTVRDRLIGLGEPTGSGNHVLQPGARVYTGHTGSPLDQPAKALKAGDHGVPGGENMMVMDNGRVRYFSLREAARLQGLPDNYEFPRSWTESMRQLGNAVPVELAESVGKWLVDMLPVEVGRTTIAA